VNRLVTADKVDSEIDVMRKQLEMLVLIVDHFNCAGRPYMRQAFRRGRGSDEQPA